MLLYNNIPENYIQFSELIKQWTDVFPGCVLCLGILVLGFNREWTGVWHLYECKQEAGLTSPTTHLNRLVNVCLGKTFQQPGES